MKFGKLEIDLFGDTDPKKVPHHLFHGALELRNDTAVRARVDRQNYTVCPRHWFIEAVFRCADCNSNFVFSVQEQRFSYETRKFYVDSRPTRCPKCRKLRRNTAVLKQRYDAIIALALSIDATSELKKEALQIIDAYAAGMAEASESMKRKRRTLSNQLKKAAVA